MEENLRSVRFVDPKTNEIVYPESLEAPLNAVVPGLGTSNPLVGALALHPSLSPSILSWDVRRPFVSYAQQWPQAGRGPLSHSATRPPTTELDIQSPHLPWRIVVCPRTPNLQITVFDVLATVHETLLPEIALGEWDQFDTVWKRAIVAEKEARVQQCSSSRSTDEKFYHPRRIDALGEFTRFVGLVPAPQRGPHSFDLKLERRR